MLDGIYDSGGSIENTLSELTDSRIIILDADGENLVSEHKNSTLCDDITFIVSDDKPLEISNLRITSDVHWEKLGFKAT